MRELDDRWPGARDRPVDEHGAAVGAATQVAELPVAVEERARPAGERVDERPRRAPQRCERGRRSGRDLAEAPPCCFGDAGHRFGMAERGFAGERLRTEQAVAVAQRPEPDRVLPSPARGVEGREVVEEPEVLLQGEWRVVGGNEPCAHVAHQQRAAGRGAGGADDRVVDAVGREVDQSPFPDDDRPAREVTGLSRDPVVCAIDVLHHERVAVDDHAFEPRARLRVRALHRFARRRTVDERVDRRCERVGARRRGAGQRVPPHPPPAWSRSVPFGATP